MVNTTKRRSNRARIALKRLGELEIRSDDADIPAYDKRRFGDLTTLRAETLVDTHRQGRDKIPLVQDDLDVIESGRWRCRYTGTWLTDPAEVAIDHLVPLKDAWASGAHAWEAEVRKNYALGVGVKSWRSTWILPVTASASRSRGSKRPDEWLPPKTDSHLTYAATWIRVKHHWGLSVLESERAKLQALLEA